MKKYIAILLALCCFVGCSPASSETTDETTDESALVTTLSEKQTVVMWHTYSEFHAEALQTLVDEFNASNEMIEVELQPQALTDFDSKVMQAVRSGVGPDVVSAYPTVAASYIEDDLIVDFLPYVTNEEIGIENYSSTMAQAVYDEASQWDGRLFIMPLTKTGEVVFYNKTLFDQYCDTFPATFSELEEVAKKITADTGKPAFGFDSEVDGLFLYSMQAGSDYIDVETNTAKINNEVMLESLETIGTLIQDGVYRLVGEDGYFSNPFGAEAVASYIGSSGGYPFVEAAVDGKFEMAVAPVPQEGPNAYVNSWGSNLMAFKTTDEKALASYEFIKWFSSPEISARWSVAFGAVPANLEGQEDPTFVAYAEENPGIAALTQSLPNVGYLPAVSGSNDVRNVLTKAIQEVALGVKDAPTALEDAEVSANKALGN